MTDKKITDEEIKSSLEVIATTRNCNECKIRNCKWGTCNCSQITANAALDLINRQKAENERLEKELMKCKLEKEMLYQNVEEIKSEAIKKFAEELKNYFSISECYLDIINIIDNLAKEMTE